jgi:uncharacterized peroxidase-related enzyme
MNPPRHDERVRRAAETPLVGGLPEYPGILAAMMISPSLGAPLRALANALLVEPFAGSTLSRAERELIATAVSAGNDCFYCMDTHGAFASALLQEEGMPVAMANALSNAIKSGHLGAVTTKLRALIRVALAVREHGRNLRRADVKSAINAGATDQDIQLAVLIASAFCMYNRIVDGLRARTPDSAAGHNARAQQIARYGYSDPRLTAVPA